MIKFFQEKNRVLFIIGWIVVMAALLPYLILGGDMVVF